VQSSHLLCRGRQVCSAVEAAEPRVVVWSDTCRGTAQGEAAGNTQRGRCVKAGREAAVWQAALQEVERKKRVAGTEV